MPANYIIFCKTGGAADNAEFYRRCPMLNTTIINLELERASEEIFRQRKILLDLLEGQTQRKGESACFPKSYLSESEQKKCYENMNADFYEKENLFTLHEKLLLNDELVDVMNKIATTDSDSYRKIIDSDMGSILKRKVFEFPDIVLLDDRGFQKVLRYVSMETIAVAFIEENDALEAKLFKNLSKRATSDFNNLMCKKRDGVEQSDVFKKQGLILKAVHRLIKKGEILFPGELIYD